MNTSGLFPKLRITTGLINYYPEWSIVWDRIISETRVVPLRIELYILRDICICRAFQSFIIFYYY